MFEYTEKINLLFIHTKFNKGENKDFFLNFTSTNVIVFAFVF